MPPEVEGIRTRDLLRWLVIGAVLLACLGAYFAYAPRVSPPLAPPAAEP